LRQLERHIDQPIGRQTRTRVLQPLKAACEQTRGGNADDRERHLRDGECATSVVGRTPNSTGQRP
jgi:hypothetical protein